MTRRGPVAIDREALLAALVLAPTTYSRNRFFELYKDPEVRHVRRRAAQIRSIVRHVTGADPAGPGEIVSLGPGAGDRVRLVYTVPALGLTRTALLDPIEIALVRFALARAGGARGSGATPSSDDSDRARIEAALARLAPSPPPSGAVSGAPALPTPPEAM
jgi:hypothetical protein